MRILRTIHSVDLQKGGVTEAVLQSSIELQKQGHTVHIISLDKPSKTIINNCPIPITPLGPGWGNYGYTSAWIPWIQDNLDTFDILIIEGLWQYHSFGTWRALRNTEKPYVVYPHGMLDPWFKRAAPFKHIKKWLYWPWGEYHVLKDATRVIFTAEQERLQAKQSFWLYSCKETVLPLGIEGPSLDSSKTNMFLSKIPDLQNKRLLLFLGRIHPKKGLSLLLEAWKSFAPQINQHNAHLVIAGPHNESDNFIEILKAIQAPEVTWTGMLTGDLKWSALRSADGFILPSHQENFGIAVVEALSLGIPVFISDKINICNEIQQSKAGFVEADTLNGTKELISKWLQQTPSSRSLLSQNAITCFNRNFAIKEATQALASTLSNFL